ncbi:MAG: preprotein translocase subunit SecG [Alphaproteobacteria bacterium]|nr:preprotein translocase subunit SecG [Alphaproteobacteria bacterium]
MTTVLLMIHLLLALTLVGVVLIQRSEGGGLGIGGGGDMGGLMSGRGTANFLTRTTAILAACFMASSMLLAYVSARDVAPESILEELDKPADDEDFTDLQTELPMEGTESVSESEPEAPSVPVDQ